MPERLSQVKPVGLVPMPDYLNLEPGEIPIPEYVKPEPEPLPMPVHVMPLAVLVDLEISLLMNVEVDQDLTIDDILQYESSGPHAVRMLGDD